MNLNQYWKKVFKKIQFPLDKYDIVLWGTEENDPVNVKAILDKKKIQKS